MATHLGEGVCEGRGAWGLGMGVGEAWGLGIDLPAHFVRQNLEGQRGEGRVRAGVGGSIIT